MEENNELKLYKHQAEAGRNVEKILGNNDFAGVILPTGAGKSFIAMQQILAANNNSNYIGISDDNAVEYMIDENGVINSANITYVVPTNEIMLQMQRNIAKYILKQNVEDKSVNEISKLVKTAFPNLNFVCYQTLVADMDKGKIGEYNSDYVILDEVHRSGAPESEKAVANLLGCKIGNNGPEYDKNSNRQMKVLALSATPERDVDGRNMMTVWAEALGYDKEKAENEEYLGADMSLAEAINQGIVIEPKVVHFDANLVNTKQYKYLVDLYNRSSVNSKLREKLRKNLNSINVMFGLPEDYDTKSEDEQKDELNKQMIDTLCKAVDNKLIPEDGKLILFVPHNRTEEGRPKIDTEEYLESYGKKYARLFKEKGIEVDLSYLSSAFTDKQNAETLNDFSNSNKTGMLKIIIASDKLNEGVHVEGISGEIMDRNISEGENTSKRAQTILFSQQIGRCISTRVENSDQKTPVIFDVANNFYIQNLDNPNAELDGVEMFKLTETQKEFTRLYNETLSLLPDKSATVVDRAPRLFEIMDVLMSYGYNPAKEISEGMGLITLISRMPLLEHKDEILEKLKNAGLYNEESGKKYYIGEEIKKVQKSFWNESKFFENYELDDMIKYGIIKVNEEEIFKLKERNILDNAGFFKANVPANFIGINIYTKGELDKEGKDIDGKIQRDYNEDGYDADGYDEYGFDKEGINRDTGTIHDARGFMVDHKNILTGSNLDQLGYNIQGFKPVEIELAESGEKRIVGAWDKSGLWHKAKEDGTFEKNATKYSEGVEPKVDVHGFCSKNQIKAYVNNYGNLKYNEIKDKNGKISYKAKNEDEIEYRKLDKNGFDKKGYYCGERGKDAKHDQYGCDIDGFDENGFNRGGIHKDTATKYNLKGDTFESITNRDECDLRDKFNNSNKEVMFHLKEYDGLFRNKTINGRNITRAYNLYGFDKNGINIVTGTHRDIYGFSIFDYTEKAMHDTNKKKNIYGFTAKDLLNVKACSKVSYNNYKKFYKSYYFIDHGKGKTMSANILGTDVNGKCEDGNEHPSLIIAREYFEECIEGDRPLSDYIIDKAKKSRKLVIDEEREVKVAINKAAMLYRICPGLQKDRETMAEEFSNASYDKIEEFFELCPCLCDDLKENITENSNKLNKSDERIANKKNEKVELEKEQKQLQNRIQKLREKLKGTGDGR